MKIAKCVLISLVILLICGCSHSPYYGWGFGNDGLQQFEHVKLRSVDGALATELVNVGQIRVNGGRMISPGPRPMPDEGEMVWMSMPDMQMHSQTLQIATEVPRPERFDGIVWIVYRGGRWVLVPITHAEEQRRSLAGEDLGP